MNEEKNRKGLDECIKCHALELLESSQRVLNIEATNTGIGFFRFFKRSEK
jgi:hypothetical protein